METHSETFLENLKEIFNHALPKALMISIPFFAFQLWLLYIRSRKKYFFVAHAIFTVHLYCAVYLYLLLMLPFDLIKLPSIVQTLIFPLLIFVPTLIYLFIAMKRFYQQGYGKTTLKFILLLMGSSVLFLLLTVGITFNALITLAVGAGH